MIKKYSTKKSLIASAISLVLCFSMLVGTTFAWFTDSVTSENNIIKSGNLKVEMHWAQGKDDPATANWQDASTGAIFDSEKWEPGYTEVRHIKIENKGSLALQYKLIIVANGEVSDLADVIDVYYLDPATQAADRSQLTENNKLGTLTEVLANLDETGIGYLASGDSDTVTLALKMRESAGNEYQKASLCDGGFSVQLLATQAISEFDSFGDDYDGNAVADFFPGFQGGSGTITPPVDDERYTTEEMIVDFGDISVVIPVGVKLAEGVTSLAASVATKNTSESNVQLNETEKMRPSDVHIEGVAEDNTKAMLITLKHYLTTGINAGAITMYHVENGVAMPMTHVATPVNHNEFSYDPLTGDLTLALASFSEVAVIANTKNPWNGEPATSFAGGDGSENNPYLIANANQLAYFRDLVDGKQKAEGINPSFAGKYVKLNNDIYLSGKLFDPIGWGYVESKWNRDGVDGKVFQGTFDGDGHTIFDLYQNGWDLEDPDKDGVQDADYTYTNCGFGLFAAASNATFKNLNISGAYVRVECVEAGVLVGLSQNSCTYENIQIHDSKIANYQRPAGGLIGEVSGDGTTTITNVVIGSDVVVGSLWGDFDAPCGGVIGARWDDAGKNPQIVMSYVEVGARMDVYSDVTSAYQWYAYRRAGMLIGNTEQTDKNNSHLAAADFLTCLVDKNGKETVKVYYGDWANYHYLQFTNQDNSWCNNYPWVRVEVGENCSAYSNPRYGIPVVNGVSVSDMNAETLKATQTGSADIRFNQLYGGGQGVYGQPVHEGVEVINYRYSITYVNDYQVLAITYVTENGAVNTANGAAKDLVEKWASANITGSWEFGGWMNAGSTKLTEIPADNNKDIVLYPYFNKPYTARFVDQQGNVVAWCLFHEEDLTKLDSTKALAEAALPNPGDDLKFDYWEVQITDNEGNISERVKYSEATFSEYENDITIYPVYLYKGDVNLIPVDSDSDGIINYYQVGGYSNPNGQAMVEIPASVNGIPILQINQNAFSSYDGVHSIVVPNGVVIQKNAFTSGNTFGKGEEITIYFEGTQDQWNDLVKETGWDYGIGTGSRVFFLKDGKVNTEGVYLQVTSSGTISKKYSWTEKNDFDSVKEQYTGYCNCENPTEGDNAHIYVDANKNVMNHNDEGTPVGNNGNVIEYEWVWSKFSYALTDGDTHTYERYRPDAQYWN